MAALNPYGIVQGFQQGLGLARQYDRDKLEQQRYDQRLALDEQARQDRLDQQQRQYNLQMQQYQDNAAYRADMNSYREQQQKSMDEYRQFQMDKEAKAALAEEGLAYLGSIADGTGYRRPDFEDQLREKGLTRFLPESYANQNYNNQAKALANMTQVALENRDLNVFNDPGYLHHANAVFSDEINTGLGVPHASMPGYMLKRKKIKSLHPGPGGTVVANLEVAYENPETKDIHVEEAPLTKYRSNNPNDPVTAADPGDFVNMVMGRAAVSDYMNTPETQANIKKAYSRLNPQRQQSQAANIQEVDALIAGGMPREEAINLVYQSPSNPDAVRTAIFKDLAAQNEAMGTGKSTSDLYAEADTIMRSMQGGKKAEEGAKKRHPQAGTVIVNANGEKMILSEDGTKWEPYEG